MLQLLVDGLELIRDGQQGFDIGLSGLVGQGLHSSLQGLETKALVLGVVTTTGDGGLGTKVDLRQSIGRTYRIAGLELLDVANEVLIALVRPQQLVHTWVPNHLQHSASRFFGTRSASQQFLGIRDFRRPRIGEFGHRSHQLDAANDAACIDRIERTLDDRRGGLDVIGDRWTGFSVARIGGVKVSAKGVFQ